MNLLAFPETWGPCGIILLTVCVHFVFPLPIYLCSDYFLVFGNVLMCCHLYIIVLAIISKGAQSDGTVFHFPLLPIFKHDTNLQNSIFSCFLPTK